MAVAKYDEEKGLIAAAPSYHRTFVCDKEWFEAHKKDIPVGTLIYITDDARETLEVVENMVNELREHVDEEDEAINERLDAIDELNLTQDSRIEALENGADNNKLNKPTTASSSNRFLTYAAGGTTTEYRDLSTVRAWVSNGILYLQDN